MSEKISVKVTREVSLCRKEVVAALDIEQKREDLQSILSNGNYDDSLDGRLSEYLKFLGLIDTAGDKTKTGLDAEKTGFVFEKEYGQYEIWYLMKDKWLKTVPLVLRRISVKSNNSVPWDKSSADELSYSDSDNPISIYDVDSRIKAKIKSINTKSIRKIKGKESNGQLICTGDIDSNKFKCNLVAEKLQWSNKEIPTDINLSYCYKTDINKLIKLSTENDYNYDDEKRWIVLNKVEEDPSIFLKKVEVKYDQDNIIIENIPLHAASELIAEQWLNALYHSEWKDHLVTKEEIEVAQKQWLDSTVFQGYDLQPKRFDEVLENLKGDMTAFWNVATMNDLRPSTMKCRIPFTIEQNKTDVEKLLQKHLFDGRSVQKIIISDRYVEEKDIDNDDVDKIKIIMNLRQLNDVRVTIYSRKKLENLPDKWRYNLLPKKRDPNYDDHGRYWLIKADNTWEYWSINHSLTPLKIQPDKSLKSDAQITVTPIYMIPKYLDDEIKRGSKQ